MTDRSNRQAAGEAAAVAASASTSRPTFVTPTISQPVVLGSHRSVDSASGASLADSSSLPKTLVLGACFRVSRQTAPAKNADSPTLDATKRARGLAVCAFQGHSVALIRPDAQDVRSAALVSYPLLAHEHLSAPPLSLVTASRGGAASSAAKGKDSVTASAGAGSGPGHDVLTIVCLAQSSDRPAIIKVFKSSFLSKTYSQDRIVASTRGDEATDTLELSAEVVQMLPISANEVLCIDSSGALRQLSLATMQLHEASDAKLAVSAAPAASKRASILLPPEALAGAEPHVCAARVVESATSAKGKARAGKADRAPSGISLEITLTPVRAKRQGSRTSITFGKPVTRPINLPQADAVLDMSMHSSGAIHVLSECRRRCQDILLVSFVLTFRHLAAARQVHTLRLRAAENIAAVSWSTASTKLPSTSARPQSGSSIAALNASFCCVIGASTESQVEYNLLDTELGVCLRSVSSPALLAGQMTPANRTMTITSAKTAADTVIVGVSIDSGNGSVESALHGIQVRAPENSSVRAALDALSIGDVGDGARAASTLKSSDQALLDSLTRLSSEGNVAGMDSAFIRWLAEASASEPVSVCAGH